MAEAALSKSLDDLIKEQRQTKDKQQKPKRPQGKPAPKVVTAPRPKQGERGGRNRGRLSGGGGIAPANLSVTVQGAVSKPRRAEAPRRPRVDPERVNPELRVSRLEGGQRWGHDMFEGERPRGPRAPSSQGTKIFVSNLDFKVTKEDIGELFEAIGPLASHDIHWDASGRSAGTGEAVFKARADAEVAMQRYNNLQLDGRAMSLTLIEKMERAPSGSVGRRLKSGLTLSAAPGSGPRVVSVTRSLGQAVGAATSQARGRGSLRSVVAMQE